MLWSIIINIDIVLAVMNIYNKPIFIDNQFILVEKKQYNLSLSRIIINIK